MAERLPLFERGGLCLSLSSQPDPAAVDLLCNTLWGTPGGTRYQHLDTRKRIFELPEPAFLQLHKSDELLGVLSLSRRDLMAPGAAQNAWYVRYFSMQESLRRKSGKDDERSTEVRDSLLKRTALTFFNKPTALLEMAGRADGLFYAYVTLDNARSRNMCEMMGFAPVRSFSTLAFSRMYPRKDARVRPARADEQAGLQARVRAQYAGHGFFPDQIDLTSKDFWVFEVDGKIVAGLRGFPVHWRMAEMPGWSGKLILRVLPRIPFLRRLFNPEKFHFVAVEAMFCEAGREEVLYRLLGHVCAAHGLTAALFWMDEQDPLRVRMLAAGKLGLLYRLNHAASVHVIVKGLDEAGLEALRQRPAYIGASDLA